MGGEGKTVEIDDMELSKSAKMRQAPRGQRVPNLQSPEPH